LEFTPNVCPASTLLPCLSSTTPLPARAAHCSSVRLFWRQFFGTTRSTLPPPPPPHPHPAYKLARPPRTAVAMRGRCCSCLCSAMTVLQTHHGRWKSAGGCAPKRSCGAGRCCRRTCGHHPGHQTALLEPCLRIFDSISDADGVLFLCWCCVFVFFFLFACVHMRTRVTPPARKSVTSSSELSSIYTAATPPFVCRRHR
jgi:hypothetical protein